MNVYSVFPPNTVGFSVPANSEREARELARYWLNVNKLPKGTLVHKHE